MPAGQYDAGIFSTRVCSSQEALSGVKLTKGEQWGRKKRTTNTTRYHGTLAFANLNEKKGLNKTQEWQVLASPRPTLLQTLPVVSMAFPLAIFCLGIGQSISTKKRNMYSQPTEGLSHSNGTAAFANLNEKKRLNMT